MTSYFDFIAWAGSDYLILLLVFVVIGICSYGFLCLKTSRIVQLLCKDKSFLLRYKSRKAVRFFLIGVGIVSLALACLRPQWGTMEQKVAQDGRDLFILLDISGSMKVIDCFGKSRLDYAKEKIKDFVLLVEQTRVGLILFSNTAFIQCPLTFDKKAFFMFVDAVDVEAVSVGSTMIEKALLLVLDTYRSVETKKHKLALILTDGEDFSHTLDTVKKTAFDERLSIFAMGIGSEKGAPIPLYNSLGGFLGYQKDGTGKVVVSRLNEGLLRDLTNKVNGTYVAMSHDNSDIQELLSIVHQQEKEQIESTMVAEKIDQYWPFVLVSFCSLLLEWII
jgi:Ca-activated chloride channel family protein